MHDAVVRSSVYGVGNLLKIHHVVAATSFGGHKPVFNDKCKSTTKEIVRSSFGLGGHQARNPLFGLNVHQRAVKTENLPLNVQIFGIRPWKQLAGIELVLLADHKVQHVFQMFVLAFVRFGQIVRFVRQCVVRTFNWN